MHVARIASAVALLAIPAIAHAQPELPAPTRSGYYHYAIYGEGEPLLLLHGGLGSIEMFGRCCRCWRPAGR